MDSGECGPGGSTRGRGGFVTLLGEPVAPIRDWEDAILRTRLGAVGFGLLRRFESYLYVCVCVHVYLNKNGYSCACVHGHCYIHTCTLKHTFTVHER
jgi:hypothetical protein